MIQRLFIACLITSFSFATAFAQGLQNNIPKDATFVLSINPSVLNSKVKFSKLKEFDFMQQMMREMNKEAGPMAGELKKFMDDPAQFGLDLMSSSYVFGKMDGEDVYFGFAMNIGDKTKFDELIQTYVAPMMPVQKVNGMEVIVPDDEAQISWDGKHLFITGVELDYKSDEEYEAFKARKKAASEKWANSIISNKATNSISTVPKFKMANVNQDDINLFMDYNSVMELTQKMQGGVDPSAQMMMGMMSGLYEDTYLSMGLNFDKGATNLSARYFMNDKMMDIYRKVSNSTFNKNFLKYIPKKNLGYFTFNYSMDNLIDVIKTSDNPMLAQFPLYEGMAVEALKGMGVEMTADELYNVWKGDMMVVVTDMKEFEKEVTTYEFDEDFNKKEVKTMKKEKLPEFVMMMSHGNQDNVTKLIQLGKQSSMISEEKGYFQVNVPDMPMDVFVKVHKDMIVVSNNKSIATKKPKKVFKKKNRLGAKEAARIVSSSQRFYWNIPGTMNILSEMGEAPTDGPEGMLYNMGKNSFDSVVMEADKAKLNSVNTVFSLNFNNKDMNSLEQIFSLINDAFQSMNDGSSM